LIEHRTKAEIDKGAPQIVVRVIDWANSAVTLRATVWAANIDNAFIMKCDLLQFIKERFDQEGIEIPFPTTNVILKKETE
jgi:small-conductance mechanosensitive channel